jgi:hypothetical protein
VNAAKKFIGSYDRVGWRSVTQLNDSPRIALLRERHDAEIEVDVSDLMWMLLGTVVHLVLEKNQDEATIAEQRILVPFEGKEISMKADYLDLIPGSNPPEYSVQDYKITQTWAWKFGIKQEQIAQNNIYRWGYRKHGFNCVRGELEMFLKDWSAMDAKISPHDYPAREVMRVPVPDWSDEKCEQYLRNRVNVFKAAELLPDDQLPECSIQERWGSPDCFAVKAIKDGKLADKASPGASKFESRLDAEKWIASKKSNTQYAIEFRKGENKRCSRNACWVNRWCNQCQTVIQPDF